MENIKDFDDDGFELSFEDGISTEERKFYVQTFTNVNMAADQRNHCTCCNTHIGTAPSAEKIVCMHPVLRVTQCVKCNRFYNSGEFDKGEDGSELYCRWCGQGGDVYCCSDCPYVFCKKCILQNLSKSALNEVTSNDNWKCYSCAPAILYPLRARHWALTNFIQKQKKKIEQMAKRVNCDQDLIADAMIRDVSVCCKNKAAKSYSSYKRKRYASASESADESDESSKSSQRNRKKKMSRKPVENSNSDAESVDAERSSDRSKSKRQSKTNPIDLVPKKVPPKISVLPNRTSNAKPQSTAMLPPSVESSLIVATSESNDVANVESTDIDCTPDLFSFLVNHGIEQTIGSNLTTTPPEQPSSATHSLLLPPSTSSPLMIHSVVGSQLEPTPAQPQRTAPIGRRPSTQTISTISGNNSVFHNYNGYRIDLQNAAKQSTIRLPNGKIIHVKKHTQLARSSPASTIPRTPTQTVRVPAPQGIRPQIVQSMPANRLPGPQRMRPLGPRPRILSQPQRPTYVRPSILQAQRPPAPYTTQNAGPNHMYSVPFQASTGNIYPNQMQMNPNQMSLNNANAPPPHSIPRTYTNDKIGRARTQLEQQIFNAISICHQIDGKLKTLMNSNAYKNANKLNDIKELYIHLSYLFTYTNGRFKTLQEKCMDDMRSLGFKSFAKSLSSGHVIDKYGSDAEEDELTIVEPSHQTISLDSDDEQSAPSPQKKSSQAPTTVPNETSVANQVPVITTLDTQILAQPSSSNNSNALEIEEEQEANLMPLEIDASTEHLECDVDIMALLQPHIMFGEDDNIESLLTRMDEEIEIGTPPLSEEIDIGINAIDTMNDLKLKSNVTVRLSRAEMEFPEMFKKLKEFDENTEAESSDDIMIIDETNSDNRPASNLDKHTEEMSSNVNEDNVDGGGETSGKRADNNLNEEDNPVAGNQIDKSIVEGVELSKEADISCDEKNEVAGNQIDRSIVDGVELSKEADVSGEEKNEVAGNQIDSSIVEGVELPKEADVSGEEKNEAADDLFNCINEMIPEIEEPSITASIEMIASNEPRMDGESSTTDTLKELDVSVDNIDDTLDEKNCTMDDTHSSSIKITTTEKSTVSEAQDSVNAQSNEEKSTDNDMELIEKTNDDRTAESIQQNDVEGTAPIAGHEVNEENVHGNDAGETSKLFDPSNGDFDNISSPDTFDEMAKNGEYDNLDFADATDPTNN